MTNTTNRIPMPMDEFIELVKDRLNWWDAGNGLSEAKRSLYDEFLEYTRRCYDPDLTIFKDTEPLSLREWVDNWVANAESISREDVAETYRTAGSTEMDDDARWAIYCALAGWVHNNEYAFSWNPQNI